MEIKTWWLEHEKYTVQIIDEQTNKKVILTNTPQSISTEYEVTFIAYDKEHKRLSFKIGPHHYQAQIIHSSLKNGTLTLFVYKWKKAVILHFISPIVKKSTEVQGHLFKKDIISPLSGRIASILVKQSQKISKNQPLLIIESMKMENEIRAPYDAFVKTIPIQERDLVESGQVLITLEEEKSNATTEDQDVSKKVPNR